MTENLFVTFGVFGWILAIVLGVNQTIEVAQDGGRVSLTAPSSVSGPTAGGFAIAGGLCFVAAALVHRASPPPGRRSLRGASAERDIAGSRAALENWSPGVAENTAAEASFWAALAAGKESSNEIAGTPTGLL